MTKTVAGRGARWFRAVLRLLFTASLVATAWGEWWQPARLDDGTITDADRFLYPIETNAALVSYGRAARAQSVAVSGDGRIGMAVLSYGEVVRSDDGGVRWRRLPTPPDARPDRIVMSSDGQRAIALGDSTPIRTEDGGATWTQQATGVNLTVPQGRTFGSIVLSADGLRALIVTGDDSQRLLRTEDGGRTWTAHPGPKGRPNGKIALAADGLRALMPMDSGTLWRTADGGRTWSDDVTAPRFGHADFPGTTAALVYRVALAGDGRVALGVIGGGALAADGRILIASPGALNSEVIVRSDDGGKTWSAVATRHTVRLWHSWVLAMSSDGQRAVDAGGNSDVQGACITSDGGKTWVFAPIAQRKGRDSVHPPKAAFSADGLRGLAEGSGDHALVRTSEGGLTWQGAAPPARSRPLWRFVTAALALVLLAALWLTRRRPGGLGVSVRARASAVADLAVAPVANRRARPAALLVLAAPALAAAAWGAWRQPALTVAGEATLADRLFHPITTGEALAEVAPIAVRVRVSDDGRAAMALFGNEVLRSEDGGAHWFRVPLPADAVPWNDIALSADGRRALVLDARGLVLRTDDGGRTWSQHGTGGSEPLLSVALSDDGMRAVIAGNSTDERPPFGRILSSADGGITWTVHRGAAGQLALAADGRQALLGREWSRTILRTRDGGATWTTHELPDRQALRSVTLSADGRIGFAASHDGGILRSDDGGETWRIVANASARFKDIVVSRNGRRVAVVDAGGGYVSADGGQTWTEMKTHPPSHPRTLALSTDGLHGVMIVDGSDGNTALRTSDGGLTWQTAPPPARLMPYWAYGAAGMALILLIASGIAWIGRGAAGDGAQVAAGNSDMKRVAPTSQPEGSPEKAALPAGQE